MEEKVKNTKEQNVDDREQVRKVAELTRELAESAKNYALVSAAYSIKMARTTVSKSVEDLKKNISEQAKEFGIKLDEADEKSRVANEQVEKVLEMYKGLLEDVNRAYNGRKQELALEVASNKAQIAEIPGEILELQSKRRQLIRNEKPDLASKVEPIKAKQTELRKLAAEALKYGNDESAKKIMEEIDFLKNKVKELEAKHPSQKEEYEKNVKKIDDDIKRKKDELQQAKERTKILKNIEKEIEQTMANDMESIKIVKNEYLAKIQNNTIMDKLKGFFARKFKSQKAKSEDFNKKVMQVIEQKLDEAKVKIPQIKEKLTDKVTTKKDEIIDKSKQFAINARDGIVEKGQELKANFKERVNDAIDFGRSLRNGAIDRMVQLTERMNERSHEMQERINDTKKVEEQESVIE